MSNDATSQQELRPRMIVELEQALAKVRDLVSQLNECEQQYMLNNSVTYRRLVHTIEAALRVKLTMGIEEALKRD
jgi:hypothetical protein